MHLENLQSSLEQRFALGSLDIGNARLSHQVVACFVVSQLISRITSVECLAAQLAHGVDQFLGVGDQLAAQEVVLWFGLQFFQQGQGLIVHGGMVPDHGSGELPDCRIAGNGERQMGVPDVDIIGSVVEFDEAPLTIVGVMPKGTEFGIQHDVWIASQAWLANSPDADNISFITPLGILKPGVSHQAAQAQISDISTQVSQLYPEHFSAGGYLKVIPFKQYLTSNLRPVFYSIAIFSCLIVLLGAVNIANLLISRSIERKEELAIRSSIGSSTLDIYRQSLSESFLICVISLALSLPITALAMNGINNYLRDASENLGVSLASDWFLSLDSAALINATLVLGAIWLISGLGPALKLRNIKASDLLSGSKGTGRQQSFRSTKILVGTQVIAAFFILIVSGSLFTSILRLVNTDYGLETDNRYVVDLEFPRDYFINPQRRAQAISDIERSLSRNPSLNAVTSVWGLPHTTWSSPFTLDNQTLENNGSFPTVKISSYSPAAFDVLGLELIDGRAFDALDQGEAFIPTIIDKQLAATYWPNESALGKQLKINLVRKPETWLTIIGISEIVHPSAGLSNATVEGTLYIPMANHFHNGVEMIIHTQENVSPAAVFSMVRQATAEVDPRIAVFNSRLLLRHLAGPNFILKLIANIFIGFSIFSVALAFVGIFAVISRSVIQQTRDIGIRQAVGSSKVNILKLYAKQGYIYLITGTLIGGGLAITVNVLLTNIFRDLLSTTPLVASLVFLGLGILVAIATLAPTSKVLQAEPGEALHQS